MERKINLTENSQEPTQESHSLPFFARFLEGQQPGASHESVAVAPPQTLKYPSDRDEWNAND